MVTVTATGMAMPRETVKVSRNIYKPYLMTIVDMRKLTPKNFALSQPSVA